jgi:hypothetical protein
MYARKHRLPVVKLWDVHRSGKHISHAHTVSPSDTLHHSWAGTALGQAVTHGPDAQKSLQFMHNQLVWAILLATGPIVMSINWAS